MDSRTFSKSGVLWARVSYGYGEAVLLIIVVRGPPPFALTGFGWQATGDVLSIKSYLPATLKSYVELETEALASTLERYFKSGSGKAFAKKRFLSS